MKIYTVTDAAQLLNAREETVRKWARTGKLPGSHIPGSGWRFTESDITEFLDSYRQRQSTSKHTHGKEVTP